VRFEPGSSHTAVRHVTARPLRHSKHQRSLKAPSPVSKKHQSTSSFPDRFFGATFLLLVFPFFFVSVPCARLSWPSCQLLSAYKYSVLYCTGITANMHKSTNTVSSLVTSQPKCIQCSRTIGWISENGIYTSPSFFTSFFRDFYKHWLTRVKHKNG